jgi:beta-lactamase regulating signal transducer with metallopeptidase domain
MNILGTVVAALLNSLWQCAAMALMVWAALRLLPRLKIRINAATRCAVWWAVLAAVVILPIAPQTGKHAAPSRVAVTNALPEAAPVTTPVPVDVMPIETSAPARMAGPVYITAGAGRFAVFAISAIWSALGFFRIARIIRSYRYLRGIQRRGRTVSPEQLSNFNFWLRACGIGRTARLLVSSEIASPMAVGFRRPAVIVPETLLKEFTGEELDHVILHELAHIARYDDWTNLFARLIGALLPIHPVAAWLLKRIEQDREISCDDWVVAMTGEPRPYAASLTRLFELCSARRRQLLATGMADRASHLGERIEALLRAGRDFAPRVSVLRVALGAAILLGLVIAGAHAPHWIAFAQEPAEAPLPPVAPLPTLPPSPPWAPMPPISPVSPVAPRAPEPPVPAADFQDGLNDQIQAADALIQARDAELRAVQAQLQNQREHGQSADKIRAAEAELQARKAQIVAMQAQVQTQLERQRAAQQTRTAAPNGSFLAALVAAGYGDISVDDIIELRNHGVSGEFLRALSQTGKGKFSTKELIALADNGVRPDLIQPLRQAFPQITVREIIEAAQQGVRPDDLRQAREFSPNLTLPQIIRLKQAGVI